MSGAPSKWRERFKVHPSADVFPPIPDDELDKMADDIKANGLKHPVVARPKGGWHEVLDGRNRMEALERAGIDLEPHYLKEVDMTDEEAVAFAKKKEATMHLDMSKAEMKKGIWRRA